MKNEVRIKWKHRKENKKLLIRPRLSTNQWAEPTWRPATFELSQQHEPSNMLQCSQNTPHSSASSNILNGRAKLVRKLFLIDLKCTHTHTHTHVSLCLCLCCSLARSFVIGNWAVGFVWRTAIKMITVIWSTYDYGLILLIIKCQTKFDVNMRANDMLIVAVAAVAAVVVVFVAWCH